jgi:rhodanese-related sulfurtransferase
MTDSSDARASAGHAAPDAADARASAGSATPDAADARASELSAAPDAADARASAGSATPDAVDTADARDAPDAILRRAALRGRAAGLGYAGAVTPAEAWALREAGAATLVDVRTHAEWTFVGRVDGAPLVEWRAFGAQQPNPRFLEQLAVHAPRDVPVLFLCRSGVRSHAAAIAATADGWPVALNVLEGFEGELDGDGRRGSRGGWRSAGLPWVQS